MKIAKFKNIKFNFEAVSERDLDCNSEYVRLTEYVDVEFTPLSNEVVILKEIEVLEKLKERTKAEARATVTKINHKIGKLIALPHGV